MSAAVDPTSPASRDRSSGGLAHALYTLVKPSPFVAATPTQAGVRYAEGDRPGVAPLGDVYLPARVSRDLPSTVVVHGGGFVIGHRAMRPVRLLATRLVEAGHAVFAIDYRLLLRGGGLTAQLEDVDQAARFWRSRCARYGCDPAKVSMLGLSAGAALTMLHAGRSDAPYRRLVSLYGPADFHRISGRRAGLLMRLVMGTDRRDAWAALAPSEHVARAEAPLLVLHGTDDRLVPVAHAERIVAARAAAGRSTELELVPGMQHGWLNDVSLPETDRAVARILRFLDEA